MTMQRAMMDRRGWVLRAISYLGWGGYEGEWKKETKTQVKNANTNPSRTDQKCPLPGSKGPRGPYFSTFDPPPLLLFA